MINPPIPPTVAAILDRLERNGYAAYAVGGALRDLLRGVEPHDWDIATSARPEEVAAVFANESLLPTGLAHGTQTLVINHIPYEITTFRSENGYSDHRRPDQVNFVKSIEEDLSRRDFTVNAIAFSPLRGFCDPFGGAQDITRRLIRCVGDPDLRFNEDGLRILRALRFAAVCDFDIETKTAGALHRSKELILPVAVERIYQELNKLLCGSNAPRLLMRFSDVITVILPELSPLIGLEQHTPYHQWDAWTHTLKVVEAAPKDPLLRWAALLHDIGKPICHTRDENGRDHFKGHPEISAQIAENIFERLKADRHTRAEVGFLIACHDRPLPPDKAELHRWLCRYGAERVERLLILKTCDAAAQSEYARTHGRAARLPQTYTDLARLKEAGACLSVHDLAVNGEDLIALGVAGKEIGLLLNELLEAVISETAENTRASLLSAARKLLKN